MIEGESQSEINQPLVCGERRSQVEEIRKLLQSRAVELRSWFGSESLVVLANHQWYASTATVVSFLVPARSNTTIQPVSQVVWDTNTTV